MVDGGSLSRFLMIVAMIIMKIVRDLHVHVSLKILQGYLRIFQDQGP